MANASRCGVVNVEEIRPTDEDERRERVQLIDERDGNRDHDQCEHDRRQPLADPEQIVQRTSHEDERGLAKELQAAMPNRKSVWSATILAAVAAAFSVNDHLPGHIDQSEDTEYRNDDVQQPRESPLVFRDIHMSPPGESAVWDTANAAAKF